jgi:hypothetical protein
VLGDLGRQASVAGIGTRRRGPKKDLILLASIADWGFNEIHN